MLHDVHGIYRSVVHFDIGVEEGSLALTRMLQAPPIYNLWQRMIIAAMCCGIIAPLGCVDSAELGWNLLIGAYGQLWRKFRRRLGVWPVRCHPRLSPAVRRQEERDLLQYIRVSIPNCLVRVRELHQLHGTEYPLLL